jgi:hypothetical protein
MDQGYKDALGAVSTALGAIVGATELPIVSLLPYVGTVEKFAKLAQLAVDAGQKQIPRLEAFVTSFSEGLPSEEVRAKLDAEIEASHAEIQAFNPKPDDDEEE